MRMGDGQLGLELLPFGKGLFSIAPPCTLKKEKYLVL